MITEVLTRPQTPDGDPSVAFGIYIVSRNGRPEAPETDSKRMVKSTGGPGSSQLQESARYKTAYPNFPETKSRVSPLSKVWFSWGTRVLLWHKQAPLGVCYVMARGFSGEHHMAAGLPVHVQYTHPAAADAGCHPGKSKDGPWRATEFNQTNSTNDGQ